jgi:hypothetical protein
MFSDDVNKLNNAILYLNKVRRPKFIESDGDDAIFLED